MQTQAPDWPSKYKFWGKHKVWARAGKYKLGARAGKHKVGARAGKYKVGARVGKYKLGGRAGKYKLGARAGDRRQGQATGWGSGNTNTPFLIKNGHYFVTILTKCFFFHIWTLQATLNHLLNLD